MSRVEPSTLRPGDLVRSRYTGTTHRVTVSDITVVLCSGHRITSSGFEPAPGAEFRCQRCEAMWAKRTAAKRQKELFG